MRRAGSVARALACAAALLAPHPIEAHEGHSDRAPWDACAGRASGAACTWEDAAHFRFVGSCRSFSDAMLCVRQRPVMVPSEAPPAPPMPAPPMPAPPNDAPARHGWRAYVGATALAGAVATWLRRRG
jgi:hypothetical protein